MGRQSDSQEQLLAELAALPPLPRDRLSGEGERIVWNGDIPCDAVHWTEQAALAEEADLPEKQ